VEPFLFDEQYVERLRRGDPGIETHFYGYFKLPIWLKARRQLRSADQSDEVVQETFRRVYSFLRSGRPLQSADKLPAFVHRTCQICILEILRKRRSHPQAPEMVPERLDDRPSQLDQLISEERKRLVRKILATLPEKDRELLRMAMLEEMDRDELCSRFKVDPDYLRVLLHRARHRFREALEQRKAADTAKAKGAE